MNNVLFGVLCTCLGAAIGGLITISTPKVQRNVTTYLFAVASGIAVAWGGYTLGKWQSKKELREESAVSSQDSQIGSELAESPIFRITYPHQNVSFIDDVKGSFEKLSENNEDAIWLYIYDGRLYFPYKVRNIDRLDKQWKVEDVTFGEVSAEDDGSVYDIQVVLASEEASSELFSGKDEGLRRLPENIKRISDKLTIKRKFFFNFSDSARAEDNSDVHSIHEPIRAEDISSRFDQLEKIEESLSSLDDERLKRLTPEKRQKIKPALIFLSKHNITLLGEQIGEQALLHFTNEFPEEDSIAFTDEQKQRFYLDLEDYFELIRISLLDQDYEYLQVPNIKQSLSCPRLYIESLKMLKQEVPEDINSQSKYDELQNRIDYLIKRISKKESESDFK